MPPKKSTGWPLIGGVVAAIGASLCCIGPLVLVMLGIGGAWIASLSALEPFRPLFLAFGVLFLLLAYRKIFRAPAPEACQPGTLCAVTQRRHLYKALFWLVVAAMAAATAFPYLAPLFY